MKFHPRLFSLLSFLALTLACQPTAEDQQTASVEVTENPPVASSEGVVNDSRPAINQRLAPAGFAAKLAALSNEQLIDVRTPGEYQTGHLPHSTLVDFKGKDFREKMAQLDKNKPVMVYCAAGGRSTAAAAAGSRSGSGTIGKQNASSR